MFEEEFGRTNLYVCPKGIELLVWTFIDLTGRTKCRLC